MPQNSNPFLLLVFTYLVAGVVAFLLYLFTGGEKDFVAAIQEINWTSYVLGICIVGLEVGYILAYRFGWNISIASVMANICLGIALVPIGVLFYKEVLTLNHLIGISFCLLGLFFINR
ncbi:MAG: EamA family transporter [Eubacteriaceae bacterium]